MITKDSIFTLLLWINKKSNKLNIGKLAIKEHFKLILKYIGHYSLKSIEEKKYHLWLVLLFSESKSEQTSMIDQILRGNNMLVGGKINSSSLRWNIYFENIEDTFLKSNKIKFLKSNKINVTKQNINSVEKYFKENLLDSYIYTYINKLLKYDIPLFHLNDDSFWLINDLLHNFRIVGFSKENFYLNYLYWKLFTQNKYRV